MRVSFSQSKTDRSIRIPRPHIAYRQNASLHRSINDVKLKGKLTDEDECEKQIIVQFKWIHAFAALRVGAAQKVVGTSIAQRTRLFERENGRQLVGGFRKREYSN